MTEVTDAPAALRHDRDQPTRHVPTGITGDPTIVHMLEEEVQVAEPRQPVNEVLGGRPVRVRESPPWLADYVRDPGPDTRFRLLVWSMRGCGLFC